MKEPTNRETVGALRLGRRSGQRSVAELPGVQLAFAGGAGIWTSIVAPWGAAGWSAIALAAGVAAVLLPLAGSRSASRRRAAVALAAAATMLAAGAAMAAWNRAWNDATPADDIGRIAAEEWQPIVLRATIVSSPERRLDAMAMLRAVASQPEGSRQPQYRSTVELRVRAVRSAGRWRSVSGTVRASVGGDISERLVGDRVIVFGHLRRIGGPRNPGAVDMRQVYAARGITARLRVDSASQLVLESPGRWGPGRVISWIGTAGEQVLYRYVGEEAGPLSSALVLGRRQAVDSEIRDQLVETGTVHLLSVSGMHLSMVAWVVAWVMVLSGRSRGWQVCGVMGVCIFYAALTGADPPVLRAAMLVGALLVGSWAGKQASVLNSLGLAAVVLMILNPHHLLQTGTQLSFVAVIALVLAGRRAVTALGDDDPLDSLLRASRPWVVRSLTLQWRRARQFTFVSFWVWAATTPLVWQAYNIVAPISVLANLLIVGPLTVAMVSGLLTALVGLLLSDLALPFGWICRGCLELMHRIVEWAAEIPLGHFWLPPPPLWWVACFYAVILVAAFLPLRWRFVVEHRGKWMLGWMVAWTLVAWPLATHRDHQPGTLGVTFVDVGHGTSALLELPAGGIWLYDAGGLGDPAWAAQPIQDVLWSRGIWHLDGIIVSHADADHYNAIPHLLDRFHVDTIVTAPGMIDEPQSGLVPLREAIAQQGTPVREVHEGAEIGPSGSPPWGRFLHPPATPVVGSDNANSLVLRIDHRGTCLLLPGDLEMPGSQVLLRHPRPPPGGILMAPHHGSLAEDARTLLDWVRPRVVVISGGDRSLRPEVQATFAQGGAEVHRTAAEGAVQIEVDPQGHIRSRS